MKNPAIAFLLVLLFVAACLPARTSAPSVSAPTSTSSPPSPEPSPTSVLLNVSPDVKAVIDAQKAAGTFKVDGQGRAVISVEGKDITLEKLVDTKTDFGLAEDILNGVDPTTGIRYLYTEKGGWAKVIEPGTPENRTKIDYADLANGRVNASAALLYQDHPTIPPGAIDVPWWFQNGANGPLREIILTRIPAGNGKEIQFNGHTKPFGEITLWLEFSVNGVSFVSAVQPNNNPGLKNKNQKINLNWTFDQDRFDQTGKNIDNITDFIKNNKMSLAAYLEPDASKSSLVKRLSLLAGPDNIFSTPTLQTPGAQVSLFSADEQAKLEANFKIIDSGKRVPNDKMDTHVTVLPAELANEPLTAGFTHFSWGDFKP